MFCRIISFDTTQSLATLVFSPPQQATLLWEVPQTQPLTAAADPRGLTLKSEPHLAGWVTCSLLNVLMTQFITQPNVARHRELT